MEEKTIVIILIVIGSFMSGFIAGQLKERWDEWKAKLDYKKGQVEAHSQAISRQMIRTLTLKWICKMKAP